MKKMTILVAARNSEATIESCLKSLVGVDATIVVGDIGSSDRTADIAKAYADEVLSLDFRHNYSECKNKMADSVRTEFALMLDANESIVKGAECIPDMAGPSRISVVQEQVVTKPIRIWRPSDGTKFRNPTFEHLSCEAGYSEIYVKASMVDRGEENMEIIRKWQERSPLALEPQYYKSCVYLSQRNYKEFISCANHYLFKGKPGSMPYVMTKYYLGMVYCYVKKDYQQASKNVFECIATKPLMAEFWCLLGDIYHSLDMYEKAYSFYENSMILGSRRLKNDDWPFQIDKYKKHPESMMKNCADIKGKSKLYVANK